MTYVIPSTEQMLKFSKFELIRTTYEREGNSERVKELVVDCGPLTLILSRQEVLALMLWMGVTK